MSSGALISLYSSSDEDEDEVNSALGPTFSPEPAAPPVPRSKQRILSLSDDESGDETDGAASDSQQAAQFVSQRTRRASIGQLVSEVPPEEVQELRRQREQEAQEALDRRQEAAERQEALTRAKRKQPYQGRTPAGDNIYYCPTCGAPNHYERDACSKLNCHRCHVAFCVECLRPASEACVHLYGLHLDEEDAGMASNGKRRRLGAGSSSAGASSSQSSMPDATQPMQPVQPRRPPATGARASQLTPRQLEGPSGVIMKVKVENFRNLTNFKVDFGPHANFIRGDNGSGKSSILAAIVVALGGNPNKHSDNAGGAKAAQGLIKDGQRYATAEIEIANGGYDMFTFQNETPEIITLGWLAELGDRGITQKYSLCGKRVTRAEVLKVRDHFNLQVENPCVILTQAVAANYLRNAKDKDKRYAVPKLSPCALPPLPSSAL